MLRRQTLERSHKMSVTTRNSAETTRSLEELVTIVSLDGSFFTLFSSKKLVEVSWSRFVFNFSRIELKFGKMVKNVFIQKLRL